MKQIFNIKERIKIILARRSFLFFCIFIFPSFSAQPHHIKIAEVLQEVLKGKILRAMFFMPPRHGKSLMCSELYPAWWLGHNPTKQIIHVSYASALSNSFSMKVRALIATDSRYKKVFPHMALDPARKRLDDWKTIQGGGFKSIGAGGGITGHGADLFIIDDIHKEGDEQSPRTLQTIYDWYNSAARTRLSPGAAVLFIMTRWSPRDLAGRLIELMELDRNADQWLILSFPAIALENDPLGRNPGEALWPARFSLRNLLAIKAISERYFEALFQQNPKATNQPLFELKNFERRHLWSGDRGKVFLTADLAMTKETRSDYTVVGLWSYHAPGRLELCEVWRFREQWPEVKDFLKSKVLEYKAPLYMPNEFIEIITTQALKSELKQNGYLIRGIDMKNNKIVNASHLSDFSKNNNLVVQRNRNCDIFVKELCGFPDEAEQDDCVDMAAVAGYVIGLNTRFNMTVASIGRQK